WKWLIGVILVTIGSYLLVTTVIRALFYNPDTEIPTSELVNEKPQLAVSSSSKEISSDNIASNTNPDYPARLSIPKINVDANIEQVGITYKGNMSTPPNYVDVGWYK